MKMADLINSAPQCGKHSEYGKQGKSQMNRLIEREEGESLEMIGLSTLSSISPKCLFASQESFFPSVFLCVFLCQTDDRMWRERFRRRDA